LEVSPFAFKTILQWAGIIKVLSVFNMHWIWGLVLFFLELFFSFKGKVGPNTILENILNLKVGFA